MRSRRSAAFLLRASLGATLGTTDCKKKPREEGDGGAPATAAAAAATAPEVLRPGEGRIRWPLADLRASPGSGAIVAKLQQGARVAVVERRDGWAKVRALEGKSEGWVPGDAVEGGVGAPAAAPAGASVAPAAKVRVRARVANLRDAARGRKVARLPSGTLLSVLRDDGEWLEVEGAGKKGWIAREVVTPVSVPTPPAAAAAAPGPRAAAPAGESGAPAAAPGGPKGLGVGTVRFRTLNLRARPDGSIVGKLPKGSTLTVLAAEAGWLRVRTAEGKEGWVVERAVLRDGASPPSPPAPEAKSRTGRVKWAKLRLRETPPRGRVLVELAHGTPLSVLGERGPWLQVRAGGRDGWVAKAAVTLAEPGGPEVAPGAAAAPVLRQVVWTTVNLREEPSLTAKVLDKLAQRTQLRQIESQGDWVKVRTLDGQRTGWVRRRSVGAAP